ncbi:MAG TPA: Calx-beta domain-containing protein, partial [Pyrinomonadaceae bacterium]|nr:Calx-beta domain-containing protein [Pyrinomonadaceae bacterium]
NVAVTEGDADVSATFNVTLSAASAQTVKVIYRTAFGTATAPADFKSLGLTTLTFAPGETTKTVSVMVRGDTMDEPAETFQLQLSSPVNAIIATAAGTCTIMDDD